MSDCYYQFVESIIVNNKITPEVPLGFKRDNLLPFVFYDLPKYSNEQLCSKDFHKTILKTFELRKKINKNQHLHSRYQGLILFAMIALYKTRVDGQYIKERFTKERFEESFPNIERDAKPHLSKKFSLDQLLYVWETFVVAIDMMKIEASGKKCALLLAANLFSDPIKKMTLGGKPVMRTIFALHIFYSVSGVKIIPRPNRIRTSRKRRIQAECTTSDSECSNSDCSNNQVAKRYKQHRVCSDDATIQTWDRDEMSHVSSMTLGISSDDDSVSLEDEEYVPVDDQEYRALLEIGLDLIV